MSDAPVEPAPARPLDPDARAALEEQARFLQRSLADLDRELAAGDLDAADHEALGSSYRARLAGVEAALRNDTEVRAAVPRNPRRTWAMVAVVVVLALAAGFGVAQVAGRRTAGDTVTGAIRQGPRELLAQCLSKGLTQNLNDTVACYDKVLQVDPGNVEARTYRAGLQLMIGGDLNQVSPLIEVAVSDPNYPDVHAFLAVAFTRLGRPASARAELAKLDALNPTPLVRDLVADLRARLDATATTVPPASTASK